MKNLYKTLLLALCISLYQNDALAQMPNHGEWQPDSVITGSQYASDVWYSFSNGIVADTARANWHFAFAVPAGSAIYVNHPNHVRLYRVPYGIANWDDIDTTGHIVDANIQYNNEASWAQGAFNARRNAASFADLGWGTYDLSTHVITGDSLYIVRIGNEEPFTWKKMLIVERAMGTYAFRYANLDGSEEQNQSIVLANYREGTGENVRQKNFIYYNAATGEIMDREPFNDTWDVQFTQYTKMISGIAYPVSGVKINAGVTAARVHPVLPTNFTDTLGLAWTDSVVVIGDDWKSFGMPGGWSFTDSLSWVVRARDSSLWQFYFTGFGGSATGKYNFSKRLLAFEPATARRAEKSQPQWNLYPNPSNGQQVTLVLEDLNAPALLTIQDLQGRTLSRQTLASSALQALSMNDLSAGTYLVTLQTAESRNTRKLVITQ